VITGAARGMGRAYLRAFLQAGARVVAADLSWEAEEPLLAELNASQTALPLTMDVRDTEQVRAAFQATLDRFGTVDVLINNAAMRQRDLFPPAGAARVLNIELEQWQRMLDVNVLGTLRVTRCFVQPMLDKRRGSVVNVSSPGCLTAQADNGTWVRWRPTELNQPYDASKAALTNLTFSLADEVRSHNVAVNVVLPLGTRTTGSDEMYAGRKSLGLAVGAPHVPEHVVPLVLFLATSDATGETGKVFNALEWNAAHGFGGSDTWRYDASRVGARLA
jgi:NAD(P)-dependent dehydrogenase (short-subunit alcohol dehydrogenase family)